MVDNLIHFNLFKFNIIKYKQIKYLSFFLLFLLGEKEKKKIQIVHVFEIGIISN